MRWVKRILKIINNKYRGGIRMFSEYIIKCPECGNRIGRSGLGEYTQNDPTAECNRCGFRGGKSEKNKRIRNKKGNEK